MNFYIIVGASAAVMLITVFLVINRWLRHLACCCDKCGKMRQRVYLVLLPPGENTSWWIDKPKINRKRRRWIVWLFKLIYFDHWHYWIRRLIKLTFFICPEHGIQCMKTDSRPMSVPHYRHVRRHHLEQLVHLGEEMPYDRRREVERLIETAVQEARRLSIGLSLHGSSEDTPVSPLENWLELWDDASVTPGVGEKK